MAGPAQPASPSRSRAHDIARTHGWNATSFQTLGRGFSYLFHEDGYVAYVDTGSAWVFRNEPSGDPARMRSFHMREFVRIGDPADVATFRDAWLERTLGLFGRLGLVAESEVASDPFFGRSGRMVRDEHRHRQSGAIERTAVPCDRRQHSGLDCHPHSIW